MFGNTTSAHNLQDLFAALERVIGEARQLAAATAEGIDQLSFSPYYAYHAAIEQYEALRVTIEEKLPRLAAGSRPANRARLLEADRRLLALTIQSAFTYLSVLSTFRRLPEGAREVVMRELAQLRNVRERLRSPGHARQLGRELQAPLDTAEKILVEVMEKAPSLLDFEGPSRSPERPANAADAASGSPRA